MIQRGVELNAKQIIVTIEQSWLDKQAVPLAGRI